MLLEIIRVFAPVFIIIAVGVVAGRFFKWDLSALADLMVYILVPCLVFSYLSTADLTWREMAKTGLAAAGVLAACAGTAWLWSRRLNAPGLMLPSVFTNSSFMGFPICLLAFGEKGLALAVVFDVVNTGSLYTFGVGLAAGKFRENALRYPMIYAAAAGLAVNLAGWQVPAPIIMPLKMVGNAVIPLSLIMLGYRLASLPRGAWGPGLASALNRLLVGAAAGWGLARLLGLQGTAAQVVMTEAAMPAALMTYVFARKLDLNEDLVATAVFLSTVLSLFLLPLVIWAVKS